MYRTGRCRLCELPHCVEDAQPDRNAGKVASISLTRRATNEVFAGGFIYYPDNPKRVWSIDKIGKAVFYYQRELNERFMSVVT
jgi:hypothetical protein